MIHHGSCHCGRIAFDVEGEVPRRERLQLLDVSSPRGGLIAFFPYEAFSLATPEGDYGT